LGASLGGQLAELNERLARLERLLDEVTPHFNPPTRRMPPVPPATGDEEAAAEASVKSVARSLLEAMSAVNQNQKQHLLQVAGAPLAVPSPQPVPCLVFRQQSGGTSTSRAVTPLPSSRMQTPGRFMEVPRSALSLPLGPQTLAQMY
ncbi:unnamed protein product, partial [Polarella glacialis]